MSRIKWERAKFIALGGHVGIPADWPERFPPASIAALQDTSPGEFRAWQDAIESAVKAGELPSVPQVFVFVSAVRAYGGAIGAALDGFPHLAQPVPEYRQTLPAISADDFRRWLESQGEKPSEHIQAWFDAWPESERVRAENREVQAQWARIQDGHKRWERHEARIQADLQEKLAPAPPPRVEPLTAPATADSISMPTKQGVIELPPGAQYVRFEELPHLIASALWPVSEESGDGQIFRCGQAETTIRNELEQEVELLPVKNPLTFGPYMPHSGALLADCVVLVQDLRQYVAKRGLSVEVPETEAEHETEPAPVVATALEPVTIKPWKLKPVPNRLPGYRWPLYQFLKAAHDGGMACPTASDVLAAWAANPPPGMLVELSGEHRDELQYKTAEGVRKWAKRKQIQGAINGLLAE